MTQKAAKKPPKPKVVAEVVVEPEVEYRYNPEGKADPFRSFVRREPELEDDQSPLERFDLSQLSVSAIMWGSDRPRALITDPSGKGYIVSEGAAIGKNQGRVMKIDDNLIRVKETYVDFQDRATTKEVEMRLYESQGG
ncbi:MAG: pilus assembly protein PilP [Deltaproteobacteria bacterium]|nr:pilus assembly protein PilP [Deltaproteobacteria bacterium]